MCVDQAVAPARNGHSTEAIPTNGTHPPRPGAALERFVYNTTRSPEFVDITDDVRAALQRSGMAHGFAVVFSRHTTAAIRINEAEPLLLQDMEAMLARIAPAGVYYRHNDPAWSDCDRHNADSHLRSTMLGISLALQIADGDVVLGEWQSVIMAEFDGPRDRSIRLQAMGIASEK